MEPEDFHVDHVMVQGEDYAVINKLTPKVKQKKNSDVSSLISSNVNAQLSPDSTKQIESWSQKNNSVGLMSPVKSTNIEHIVVEGTDYALINRSPPKKNKKTSEDLACPTSGTKGQLSPSASRRAQNGMKDDVRERQRPKSPSPKASYVRLDFHSEKDSIHKSQEKEKGSSVQIWDYDKTKFAYSTVVFEHEKKESDKESAERLRQNRPAPVTPPKYSGGMHKIMLSDSQLPGKDSSNYHGTNGGTTSLNHYRHKMPSPELVQLRSSDTQDDSEKDLPDYVNVRRNGGGMCPPAVPPRRGVAAITEENEDSPVPCRKIS